MGRRIATQRGWSSLRANARGCGAVFAAAMLAAACQPRDGGDVESFGAASTNPAASSHLESAVDRVRLTDRIVTSTSETKQAGPDSTFVVLDVTVRNAGTQPQVFSEGRLIDVDGARERVFATPVTMLTDEFLSLQVIPPSGRVRGKIAYEVPDDMTGALYWSPMDGGKRIALRPVGPDAPATLANADADVPIAPEPGRKPDATTHAPVRVASLQRPQPAASRERTNEAHGSAAGSSGSSAATNGNEPARTLACQALLSRNDPDEKARYLGFFARQCTDFAMPSAWRPGSAADAAPVARTVPGPRWPPRSGPAFDCSQAWTRAEHLVCEDAVLSLMDWELARAYAKASRVVENPAALQRDEDEWRHRVRDACDNTRCIEAAYDRRTALLESVAEPR